MKLFWSKRLRKHWVAFSDETGLVIFPAAANGWEARQPATDILSGELREVPLRLAETAGIPVAAEGTRARTAAA